jgi:hypothetical protein
VETPEDETPALIGVEVSRLTDVAPSMIDGAPRDVSLAPAATELVDGFSFEAADLSFDLAREAAQLNLVRGPSLSRPSLPNSPAR